MNIRRLSSFLPDFISLLLALLGGVVLFNNLIISNLPSFIINVGLDPQRTQLMAALIMAAGAVLIGAVGGRRKAGAMLGSGSIFCLSYLVPFIQLELQPFRDPGGNLEPLNRGSSWQSTGRGTSRSSLLAGTPHLATL